MLQKSVQLRGIERVKMSSSDTGGESVGYLPPEKIMTLKQLLPAMKKKQR
jgi:hypothetical protein